MATTRLNPTLFDKLIADLAVDASTDVDQAPGATATGPETPRAGFRFYTVPRIERFNETALRATVRRELYWLLNTTCLESLTDLEPYPQVRTSVLNYGVRDLAGKAITKSVIQARARQIRDAVRAFEPRMDPRQLEVESLPSSERENAVTYVIRGDVTSAVKALPVEFKTDIELDTAAVVLRD